MKIARFLTFLIFSFIITSCGSSKSRVVTTKKENAREYRNPAPSEAKLNKEAPAKVNRIVNTAIQFEGTRYKFGGTDRKGMDCSGLVYVSFLEEGISLPRTSRAMSLEGKRLYLEEVEPGDLLFFETNKNRKVINHVGLVTEVSGDNIRFIHSSSSRGVIISSLLEGYWRSNFVMARRVI
ncbi:C40 family peptidase [Gramella sp. GC03-9]|uniref:C40 family peptidase n=1 Tax=Christiangramia oceanisediminis TaxID=2920386 RepID=A0A9X2KXF9_9FLAO|nr:C40 family peptidase [Gramella oceanisediminis]MCP9199666.1 C40 family peptidase [Gramella oceanisediminis]